MSLVVIGAYMNPLGFTYEKTLALKIEITYGLKIAQLVFEPRFWPQSYGLNYGVVLHVTQKYGDAPPPLKNALEYQEHPLVWHRITENQCICQENSQVSS